MTTKRITKKAPAEAGAVPIVTRDSCELIPRAEESDPEALWRLYGEAAAYLRGGQLPPAHLSAWLADRLEALAQAVRASDGATESARDKAVMQALQVRRVKRGRPASRKSAELGVVLADHVLSVMVTQNLRADPACAVVADWFEDARKDKKNAAWARTMGVTSKKFVADAWLKHRKSAMQKAGVSRKGKG